MEFSRITGRQECGWMQVGSLSKLDQMAQSRGTKLDWLQKVSHKHKE